jgi:hypothetical protein
VGTTNAGGVATGTLASTVAEGKTVSATINAVAVTQTAAVTVTAGAVSATQSTVAASPTSITAGGSGSTITVTAKDANGNPISGATVVLASTGTGNTLTQPVGTTNASGVATGTLTSTVAEAKTVSATINSVAITQTASVTVTVGAPAQVAFVQQPSTVAGGAPITPAVTVRILDAGGNFVASATNAVTVAIGSNPGGGSLGGTATVNAVAGVATFTGLTVDKAGTGYTLTAGGTGLSVATSATFNVTVGPAASLTFTTPPPVSTTPQTAFGFAVTARDLGGNTVTGFVGSVTVAIGTNPAGGTLSGTLTQSAVAGVATFSGISIDNIGAGYILSASATGPTAGTSAAFDIVAPPGVNAWINRSGGTWNTAANWSKGTVPSVADIVTIRQSGAYTVTMDVDGTAAQLDVGAPLSTQTLTLNGHKLAVAGSFSTAALGTLKMASAADSLGIGGNASFGGGSTAGLLTGGVITINGNFAQSGNASAFAPSTAHRVRFQGAAPATQTISFANPTTSFFDSLIVDRGFGSRGAVQLLTDIRVNRGMTIQNSTDITGAASRVTIAGGTLNAPQSTTSPTMTNLAIELSTTPTIGPSIVLVSPDTVVLNGGITALPVSSGLVYKNVRINTTGAVLSPGNVNFRGSLIVQSGAYTIGAGTDSVGGFLRTEGTGALAMVAGAAAPTVVATDSAVFAGGPSTSLTAGLLRIRGNFVQRGSANAFAASGTRVTFERSSGVQTIQFADPTNSFFHDLVLNRPSVDTVRLKSDVLANDSAIVTGSSVLASTAFEALKTPASGALDVHSGAVLKPSRVEFGTFFADSDFLGGPARIFPDTAVFLNGGSISSSSPAYAWKSVRVAGGSVFSSAAIYNGNLIISGGSYGFCNGADSVGGYLRTEGTGVLLLSCQEGETIAVRDSAVFAGGSSSLSGNLRVYGNFVQRGGATTFQASRFSIVEFAGSKAQTISFANPDSTAAGSQFGSLLISNVGLGVTLATKVHALGQLRTPDATFTRRIFGSNSDLAVHGLNAGALILDNVPLVVDNGDLISLFENTSWVNSNGAATQLRIRRSGGPGETFTFANLSFSQTLTTGLYVHLTQTDLNSPPLQVDLTGTTPTSTSVSFGTQTLTDGVVTPLLSWSP